MRIKFTLLLLLIISVFTGNAQVLQVTPAFPTTSDVVTVIYDATEGNGALTGVSQIYAHAGVITDQSTSLTDWKFVQGNWGTADPNTIMTSLGNDLHQITINMTSYYGFPAGTNVEKLAFVFRNADGSIVGRATDGSDIYYEVFPTNAGLLAKFFKSSIERGENIINWHLDKRALLISKDGFSVVAPIRITVPSSTACKRASCCALLKRCISSINKMVSFLSKFRSSLAS